MENERVRMFEKATMEKNEDKVTLSDEYDWQCNNCGYLLPGLSIKLVRYDYGCPKCKNTFKNFTPKPRRKDANHHFVDVPGPS